MVETSTKPSISQITLASEAATYRLPDERSPSLLQRLAIGTLCLGLGIGAISIGFSSILYRLTHATVEGGLVTGRLVRVQAPLDGEIKDFFASAGVDVQSGQVLARVAPSSQQQQTLLQLQGEVAESNAQIGAARQMLALLTNQLQNLEQQDGTLQTVKTAIASDDVTEQQAEIEAAMATATAAQADYQRYRQLLEDGVVSQQQVDHLRAEWESAQAMVDQARAELNSAQTLLGATEQGVNLNGENNLQNQRMAITQAIQSQMALINTLTTQLVARQQQLEQVASLYSTRKDVEVTAPFTGVIYSTEQETGEQVSRPDVLMTLLDCNTLWVEVLMNTEQASRVDPEKPVRIQLAGASDTVVGEVTLIEAISRAELAKDQTQALTPAIPDHLVGQPLSRIQVMLPPGSEQTQSQKLCGVGQAARLTFGTRWFGR